MHSSTLARLAVGLPTLKLWYLHGFLGSDSSWDTPIASYLGTVGHTAVYGHYSWLRRGRDCGRTALQGQQLQTATQTGGGSGALSAVPCYDCGGGGAKTEDQCFRNGPWPIPQTPFVCMGCSDAGLRFAHPWERDREGTWNASTVLQILQV